MLSTSASMGNTGGSGMLRRGRRGFTLIEMAIVLVVVGLMLGGALVGVGPVLKNSKVTQTNKKLDRIELALQTYIMQNGCLPCPANGALGSVASSPNNTAVSTNAGWSQADQDYYGPGNTTGSGNNRPCSQGSSPSTSTTCAHVIGVVPWNTLSLRDSDTVDPWQDRISYAVTSALTVTAGSSMVRTLPSTYPAGTLTVNDYAGTTTQTSSAAYVLIGHGADRAYAFAAANGATMPNPVSASASEAANTPASGSGTTFRQDRIYESAGTSGYFDDVVRFRTAPVLIQNCGKNACGNPP